MTRENAMKQAIKEAESFCNKYDVCPYGENFSDFRKITTVNFFNKFYDNSMQATIEALKNERSNMIKTHQDAIQKFEIYIRTLEAINAMLEIIIKDKTAFMNAITQRKTCDGCKHNRFGCDSTGVAVDCTSLNGNCARQWYKDYYEPKAKE